MVKQGISILICIPWLLFGQANKTGLSVAIGVHQSAPLAIDRFCETSPEFSFQSSSSVSLEGRVRYRWALGDKFALVAGLGLGGYAYAFTIEATEAFVGFPNQAFPYRENTFTTVHAVGEVMGEWSVPVSERWSLGLALGLQVAFFPNYRYRFGYIILDDAVVGPLREQFGYSYILNPRDRIFIAPRFGLGPRYDIGPNLTVMMNIVGLYTNQLPIQDAQFFWNRFFAIYVLEPPEGVRVGGIGWAPTDFHPFQISRAEFGLARSKFKRLYYSA